MGGRESSGEEVPALAQRCHICNKGPQYGQNIRHVHGGSWELRGPRTKRRWLPNLQGAKIMVDNAPRRVRVCTKCMKAGKVVRVA
jgi:large subunit ribosomal protein L28